MKKYLALIMAVLMLAVVFTGCGNKDKDTQADQTPAASTQDTSTQDTSSADETTQDNKDAVVFPITVKDANGFEMQIVKEPVQIVSLTLGTDEMLLELVEKSRIKSVTSYADDTGISNIADKVKDIPIRTASEAEQVIALQPDLVFVDTWAKAEFVKQLRDAGIAVYVFKTPSNIDEQKQTVLEIAHVVGQDTKGKELTDWMDSKLKEVEDKLKALKPEQQLVILDYSEGGTTSAKGTNFDDIVTRAGLINAATKAGMELWPVLPREMIVELNPDALVIPSWYYDKEQNADAFKKSITSDKTLETVKAVKDGRFIMVPYNHLTAISHYVVLGVEDMAKAAYPELFK